MSKPPFLPRSGTASPKAVAAAVGQAQNITGAGGTIRLRSMLIAPNPGKRWVHLATTGVLGDHGPETSAVVDVRLGPVCILGKDIPASAISDQQALELELAWWHGLVDGEPVDAPGLGTIYTSWYPSRNEWMAPPCWVVQLNSPVSSLQWDPRAGEGPFLDRERGWFSPDLSGIAREWLLCPTPLTTSTVVPLRYIILPDRRAWIRDIWVDGTTMTVASVSPHLTGQFCAVGGTDHDGGRHHRIVDLTDGQAVIDFRRSLRSLEIYLYSAGEELLDRFVESDDHSSWGRSVLQPSRDKYSLALSEALEVGEGETIEFKDWIPVDRGQAKSMEYLETLVAFGNAKGGTLYIGVDDRGEVTGVARHLAKLRCAGGAADSAEGRDRYVGALKKLAAEGISPPVPVSFEWPEVAGHTVLQVSVGVCKDRPCSLIENARFLMRRGATNRTMSRSDLEAAFRRGGSGAGEY